MHGLGMIPIVVLPVKHKKCYVFLGITVLQLFFMEGEVLDSLSTPCSF
jgi:hypothetical protein